MPATERRLLLTCEHGGNRIPRDCEPLFAGRQALLHSHRGWDAGALRCARALARELGAPLVASTTTRLLVDPNRSPHNPAVFSEVTRGLPRDARERLLARYHRPHWDRVRAAIDLLQGSILHVAVHSFTPVWEGRERAFPLGILYDPARRGERELAKAWQRRLREHLGPGSVRRNAPYRGDSDGLTTALRGELPASRYLGIELELNQRHLASARSRRVLREAIEGVLRRTSTAPRSA